MTLAKRIIPCLDIKDGRTVKGVQFQQLRDAGDPVELAQKYVEDGADELVFLDISATAEKRKTLAALVYEIAKVCKIPFTVGGGIQHIEDVNILLSNGADKVTLNTSAFQCPELIESIANKFGSQCLIVSIDAFIHSGKWLVATHGGMTATNSCLFTWAEEVTARGAGEVLFTAINQDGKQDGYAVEAIKELTTKLSIPVIASGGAGSLAHFSEVFLKGNADAALAASIFHYNTIPISVLKTYLKTLKIPIR